MKKVIINNEPENTIGIDNLGDRHAIFAYYRDSSISGMIIKSQDNRYILKSSASTSPYGYSSTLEECILKGIDFGFTFYVKE